MGRVKLTNDEKKLVVLELLRGQKSVSQVARERGISDAMVYRWREQALKAIEKSFGNNGRTGAEAFAHERERFLKIIGEQTVVIETLKKISTMS